jgi:hypothetical protein
MSCFRAILLSAFALAVSTWAQSTRSVILGSVTDQSGSAIPAAEVTVSNEKTNIATKTTTSSEGQYTVTNLEPGAYRVSVSAKGFKTGTIRDITMYVNQTARVDVKLDVGDSQARRRRRHDYRPSPRRCASDSVRDFFCRQRRGLESGCINGGAIIDHEAPCERCFVAVQK